MEQTNKFGENRAVTIKGNRTSFASIFINFWEKISGRAVKQEFENILKATNRNMAVSLSEVESSSLLHQQMLDIEHKMVNSVHDVRGTVSSSLGEVKDIYINLEQEKQQIDEQKSKLEARKEKLEEKSAHLRIISIQQAAKDAELRQKRSRLDDLKIDLKEREKEIFEEYEETKRQQQKNEELESGLLELEAELAEKSKETNALYQRTKSEHDEATLHKEICAEETQKLDERIAEFERRKLESETTLSEKIAEFEKRKEELELTEDIIQLAEFDESSDGNSAKLVVQEAIRQSQKQLKDALTYFEELEGEYCDGTFKGFSMPLTEIEVQRSQLTENLSQIHEYVAVNDELPVGGFVELIEASLIKAEDCIGSWEFPEAYRAIIQGLSIAKAFETILEALNEWGEPSNPDLHDTPEPPNYYEILNVKADACEDEIKKSHRQLVKRYHPDKFGQDLPDDVKAFIRERFHNIQQAYEMLSDPDKRSEYDQSQQSSEEKL